MSKVFDILGDDNGTDMVQVTQLRRTLASSP